MPRKRTPSWWTIALMISTFNPLTRPSTWRTIDSALCVPLLFEYLTR
jgi:hypothetical protein